MLYQRFQILNLGDQSTLIHHLVARRIEQERHGRGREHGEEVIKARVAFKGRERTLMMSGGGRRRDMWVQSDTPVVVGHPTTTTNAHIATAYITDDIAPPWAAEWSTS
jgi:hypothetical protein